MSSHSTGVTIGPNTDTSATAADDSLESGNASFVDYVPSPDVKVLPPAKFKLWLIIYVLVYFASWLADEAELHQFLEFKGWLSFHASLFLQLGIVVFVLVYSAIDLFQTFLTFHSDDGKIYGVVAWLKQPRAQWMYHHENFLFELLARAIHILEEGFAMFDAPPQSRSPQIPIQFNCTDPACQTTLRIEHRIKPDKLQEYNEWVKRIGRAVQQNEGMLGRQLEELRKETGDEEEGGSKSVKDAPYLAVVYVKFANIDYLNDWMMSPRRRALMRDLDPILDTPSITQVQKNRALPDAFSDLLIRQGSSAPKSPPKKWKVWWLTLLALNITIRWSQSFLPYYYDFWGVTEIDQRLQRAVDLFIVTFLNSYIMTPLFLFLFDHWLQKSDVHNIKEPWKTLDEGIVSIWAKLALSVAFYGGCVVAILVKKYT